LDYLALRNRLLFTAKHFPWALPTMWMGLWISILNRIRRRQWERIGTILKIMLGMWDLKKLGFEK